MKTVEISAKQISSEKSAKTDTGSIKDSASPTTERSTTKTRNFGWLVTGMVEACQQMSVNDLVEDRQ